MEKALEKLAGSLDPMVLIESILPLSITVKLKIYKAKDSSYVLQIFPVEEKK